MFRSVPLSIIRNFSLYTQQWYMSYRFADSLRGTAVPSWSCSQAVSKPVWHIPLLCVQWKIPDDGQRNCPKHVKFNSENKFEKLVHLFGFIIRMFPAVTHMCFNIIQGVENRPCLCHISRDTRPSSTMIIILQIGVHVLRVACWMCAPQSKTHVVKLHRLLARSQVPPRRAIVAIIIASVARFTSYQVHAFF